MTALAFYEYTITFQSEVRLVWKRRMTGASVIFLLMRYATLVWVVLVVLPEETLVSHLLWRFYSLNLT